MKVGIYRLSKGFDLWTWLCQKHLDERREPEPKGGDYRRGWEKKEAKRPKHELRCQDCPMEEDDFESF